MSDRRTKRLAKARAELAALPDLTEDLARCLTERGAKPDGGSRAKITGSAAPLRLDVLHLTDDRLKPGWDGHDPRETSTDRFGVLGTLASWVRIVWEESDLTELAETPTVVTETSTLVEWWPWIEQRQWADELAEDVLSLGAQVRHALGEVRLLLRCPQCADQAFVDGLWLVCDSGHETSVRNLAQQERRRAAMTDQELAAKFGIAVSTVRVWAHRGRLKAVTDSPKRYMPWDVLGILNPDLVEAAEAMDAVSA